MIISRDCWDSINHKPLELFLQIQFPLKQVVMIVEYHKENEFGKNTEVVGGIKKVNRNNQLAKSMEHTSSWDLGKTGEPSVKIVLQSKNLGILVDIYQVIILLLQFALLPAYTWVRQLGHYDLHFGASMACPAVRHCYP